MKRFMMMIFILLICTSCTNVTNNKEILENNEKLEVRNEEENHVEQEKALINPEGNTISERIYTPTGYSRVEAEKNTLIEYIRNMELMPHGSAVLTYEGIPKGLQTQHVAVFTLSVGNKDLQQCADSIMRVYAEFYYHNKQYDKIQFHLTNGFLMQYTKWRDGNRLRVNGNQVSWVKTKEYDNSYDNFLKYLESVFMYAGTMSLNAETKEIRLEDMQVGDIFVEAGSPGHAVMVVDMAVNEEGNKIFLLAQGYMPAQQFHILKNPLHEEDCWYYLDEIIFPFQTPAWSFGEHTLKRFSN